MSMTDQEMEAGGHLAVIALIGMGFDVSSYGRKRTERERVFHILY
jgi:hypothetical protein